MTADALPMSDPYDPSDASAAAQTTRTKARPPETERYNDADPFSGTAGMTKADTPTLRAFALLEHLVNSDGPVSLADIAQDVALPKASLHRMLASLEAGGLVIREPGQKNAYVIGPRLAQLALGVVMHPGTRRLRHAILARLVADLGETCNLTMLHETEVLYLDRMEAPWPLRLDLKPGSHVPAYCSASASRRTRLPTRSCSRRNSTGRRTSASRSITKSFWPALCASRRRWWMRTAPVSRRSPCMRRCRARRCRGRWSLCRGFRKPLGNLPRPSDVV